MLVEYTGNLEKDTAIAKESMMLLIGDAWHSYAEDLGLKPLETMTMIDAQVKRERAK